MVVLALTALRLALTAQSRCSSSDSPVVEEEEEEYTEQVQLLLQVLLKTEQTLSTLDLGTKDL